MRARGPLLTLGIDVAAQPTNTYGCVIDWSGGGCSVVALHRKLGDDALVGAVTSQPFDAIGVDVPFGWPLPFVDLLAGRGTARSWSEDSSRLRLRATDRHCKAITGKDPLSVAADRIAAPAMRWRLLSPRVAAAASRLHEVYPGAALAVWGLEHKAYKRREQRAARVRTLDALRARLGLQLAPADVECVSNSADALDAVIAALVARAIATGQVHPVPPEMAALAGSEGWIAIPRCSLDALRDGPRGSSSG